MADDSGVAEYSKTISKKPGFFDKIKENARRSFAPTAEERKLDLEERRAATKQRIADLSLETSALRSENRLSMERRRAERLSASSQVDPFSGGIFSGGGFGFGGGGGGKRRKEASYDPFGGSDVIAGSFGGLGGGSAPRHHHRHRHKGKTITIRI